FRHLDIVEGLNAYRETFKSAEISHSWGSNAYKLRENSNAGNRTSPIGPRAIRLCIVLSGSHAVNEQINEDAPCAARGNFEGCQSRPETQGNIALPEEAGQSPKSCNLRCNFSCA